MWKIALFAVFILTSHPFRAWAQVQALQQPVVRQFGVGTSVSVPDQGRVHLGRVSKGATGRKMYGPLRSGTNSGFEYSNASQSASVYIFDFDAMDRELLESANRDASIRNVGTRDFGVRSEPSKIHSRAESAWQSMMSRQRKSR